MLLKSWRSDVSHLPAHSLFVTDHEIPAFGAQPGDLVLIRPAHATDPLMIIRRFDRGDLPFILDHFDQLRSVTEQKFRRRRKTRPEHEKAEEVAANP